MCARGWGGIYKNFTEVVTMVNKQTKIKKKTLETADDLALVEQINSYGHTVKYYTARKMSGAKQGS